MQRKTAIFPLRTVARLWHKATKDRNQPANKGLKGS